MNYKGAIDRMSSTVQWELTALLATLAVAGCSDPTQPAPLASFSRPGDVAFVCFLEDEGGHWQPRPLSECGDPRTSGAGEPVMHALVTQTETGALATVDLKAGEVLDSRPDIPGFTFVDVGDLPTTVVVPKENPDFTYVGTATGRIGVFDTWSLKPVDGKAYVQRVQEPPIQLPGGAVAAALVVAPDESALFVASPTTGELFALPICRDEAACDPGSLLEPTVFDLNSVQVQGTAVIRGPEGEPYSSRGVCSGSYQLESDPAWPQSEEMAADGGVPDAGQGDAGVADAGQSDASVGNAVSGARPVDLAIDTACDGATGCKARLLVADEALPWIHVFEIDGGSLTPVDAMATGAPTVAVAATPDVPTEVRGDSLTHYVYAIDQTDGSVLVLQDGALLPVNGASEMRVHRLDFGDVPLGTRALSLTVVSPRQDSGASMCTQLGAATNLRGVFAMVALSNGRILAYDIYDRDLEDPSDWSEDTAKLSDGTCRACPYVVRRHQRRTLSVQGDGEPYMGSQMSTEPYFIADGRKAAVDKYGATTTSGLPSLACLECPDGMAGVFATELEDTESTGSESSTDESLSCEPGEARICRRADPFQTSSQAWLLRYQGALSGSRGLGSFSPKGGVFELSERSGVRLCEVGVQGEDTLGAGGDVLVVVNHKIEDTVVSTWPEDDRVRRRCNALRQALELGEIAVAIPIEAVYDKRLVLGEQNIVSRVTDTNLRSELPATLSDIRECLHGDANKAGPLVKFEIRTRKSFVVSGSLGSTIHRVRANEEGRCLVDSALPTSQGFRASVVAGSGESTARFSNGSIALALQSQSATALSNDEALTLYFELASWAPSVLFDATGGGATLGVLPQTIRYSASDERVYVVDPHVQGLFGVPLDNFSNSASLKLFK